MASVLSSSASASVAAAAASGRRRPPFSLPIWPLVALVVGALVVSPPPAIDALGEVVYAVNCGGPAHVDAYGIHYQKDNLNVGFASDHGKNLAIRRVPPQDQVLYQTERYHLSDFAYNVPIKSDGDYVLILKFSEVWFTEPNQKVFDIQLNGEHVVVHELDIFAAAGLGIAHDELVPFSVKSGALRVGQESSSFDGLLKIEFLKRNRDNPKVNAIVVMRGRLEDVPQLPPLPRMDRPEVEDEEEDDTPEKKTAKEKRRRPHLEPKIVDPYANEDPSSMIFPIIIAIAAFIPLVFCLCRL